MPSPLVYLRCDSAVGFFLDVFQKRRVVDEIQLLVRVLDLNDRDTVPVVASASFAADGDSGSRIDLVFRRN